VKHRIFFLDEATRISGGDRRAVCLPEEYAAWNAAHRRRRMPDPILLPDIHPSANAGDCSHYFNGVNAATHLNTRMIPRTVRIAGRLLAINNSLKLYSKKRSVVIETLGYRAAMGKQCDFPLLHHLQGT
jgi:hypothetical protein